jgi:isoaspartyl peptidase/L-asparaginase-like protein (Ntn-hydrolase superfamily)
MAGKLKGRVGDAPLIGCGGYANEEGSATIGGHGESIMKVTLARQVVYNMQNGQNAQVKNGRSKYLKSYSHYLNDKTLIYYLNKTINDLTNSPTTLNQ